MILYRIMIETQRFNSRIISDFDRIENSDATLLIRRYAL